MGYSRLLLLALLQGPHLKGCRTADDVSGKTAADAASETPVPHNRAITLILQVTASFD